MESKTNSLNFIEKAINKHSNIYNYSLAKYKSSKSTIQVLCYLHGVFEPSVDNHINKGSGCPECAIILNSKKRLSDTTEFIEKSLSIHKDLNYSYVDYKNSTTDVILECIIHSHKFKVTPNEHLNKQTSCPICSNQNKLSLLRKTSEEYFKQVSEIHQYKYDYSEAVYVNKESILRIKCNIHDYFNQRADSHLYQTSGCPLCSYSSSKGEKFIKQYLTSKNIPFVYQQTFKECRYKRVLRFDFYLPNHNMCIEYDGKQHFDPQSFRNGSDGLLDIQIKDKIKNEFCLLNKIRLIRISYKDNLLEILDSNLNS